MSPVPLTTLLLDPTRLMVAGSMFGAVRTARQIADRTGAELDDVTAAINELRGAGLVDRSGDGFTVPDSAVARLTHELNQPAL